ncbi:MAG: hypothetical protein ACRDSP_03935 [Pseudonocardiaceae bacterium]
MSEPENHGGADDPQFDVVRVTEFSLRDEITEDVVPNEDPVTSFTQAKNGLRHWVVGGIGGLIAFAILLSCVLVLLRPSAAEFAVQLLQIVVVGLVGLAGCVVGVLLGRDQI